MVALSSDRVREIYEDLHRHPELAGAEHRTASVVSDLLQRWGWTVRTGVGGTGVVGVLGNGPGPTVALRADMDALPVSEETGLPYASLTPGVMHACGHDVHTACLLGAVSELTATRGQWQGTVVAVFQPAEETITGAAAMVEDRVWDGVEQPVVVLGQHVAPLPAGWIGLQPGPAFAASDSLRITLYGKGGHGSRPETTVDPVVMAAATVLRLNTVVSREVAAGDTAVLTVGAVNAGSTSNIIPDTAELLVNVRTYDPRVRTRVLAAIERIVAGEAEVAGAGRPPRVELVESAPAVVNDEDGCVVAGEALEGVVGAGGVIPPGPVTGSEDVGVLAASAGSPLVYWLLGGADPALFTGARAA